MPLNHDDWLMSGPGGPNDDQQEYGVDELGFNLAALKPCEQCSKPIPYEDTICKECADEQSDDNN